MDKGWRVRNIVRRIDILHAVYAPNGSMFWRSEVFAEARRGFLREKTKILIRADRIMEKTN